ncbi:MAG TPA: AMP-binding protein [Kineosporiaceae bacterium]|nr:AMP-binding protein [Kineosporiaceae bacterium]
MSSDSAVGPGSAVSQGPGQGSGPSVLDGGSGRANGLAVLVRAGVVSAERPDRTARRLAALAKFGPSLAGSYAAATVHDPDRIAVSDERRRLSYAELDIRARRIAARLAEFGIGPDGSVAVLQRNSAYLVESLIAISRLGADAVLLNVAMSADQIGAVLAREQPLVLIADADLLAELIAGPDPDVRLAGLVVVVADPTPDLPSDSGLSLDEMAGVEIADVPAPQRRGHFVVLTSGTTGPPKGARRGPPKGLGPLVSMLSRIRFQANEVMLIAPPLFHTWGLGMLQLAPALSSTIVLHRRSDSEILLAALAEHGCTSLITVPVMAQRLLELPPAALTAADLSSLRVVACSGAALSADLSTRFQDAFGDVLYNVYGATEVSWATIAAPEDLRLRPGSAGRPPHGTTIALLDDAGAPVPIGEIGGIHVGNDLLFEGYTDGTDRCRRDGMLATGDRGRIDGDGLLTVLGREDDLVNSGGEKVYPSVLEELLTAHPQVREVAVIGVPDPQLGQRLAAYLVLSEGSQLTAQDVRALARSRLAAFCVPRDVIFLDALPRGATGKVIPRLLPGMI